MYSNRIKVNRSRTVATKQKEPSLRDSMFGEKVVKSLPDNFFERVLEDEIKIKKKTFTIDTIQELVSYYRTAIEYYESIDDPKFKVYRNNLGILLSQPDILRMLKMTTKEGKIQVHREQRKTKLLKKFEIVDKTNKDKEIEKLIEKDPSSKVKKVDTLINNDLDEQANIFRQKREAKKKKYLLSTSDVTDAIETMKNKRRHSIENLNKSFDAVEGNTNLFGNETEIEPIAGTVNNNFFDDNEKPSKGTVVDKINKDLDIFFTEFNSLFAEQITQSLIKEIKKLNIEKNKNLLQNAKHFAIQVKETEYLLTEKKDQKSKEQLGKIIFQLNAEEKVEREKIITSYKSKLSALKKEYKDKCINNYEWISKIKAKYISDIDSDFFGISF